MHKNMLIGMENTKVIRMKKLLAKERDFGRMVATLTAIFFLLYFPKFVFRTVKIEYNYLSSKYVPKWITGICFFIFGISYF